MKWLLCPLLLSLLAVFACGGSSSPTASSSVASSPLSQCTGALPDHNIAFRGRVVSLQAPTPTVSNTIHGVLIDLDEAAAGPDAQVFGTPSWFEPHTQIWVSLRGDSWPELHPGDCVVGSGRIQGFSCSDGTNGNCDASRFEADTLVNLSSGETMAIDPYGLPKCDDPLESSEVSFQGHVVTSTAPDSRRRPLCDHDRRYPRTSLRLTGRRHLRHRRLRARRHTNRRPA